MYINTKFQNFTNIITSNNHCNYIKFETNLKMYTFIINRFNKKKSMYNMNSHFKPAALKIKNILNLNKTRRNSLL